MAKANKAPVASKTADDDALEGYEQVDTDMSSGEWVTPAPGTVVHGRLKKAFFFEGGDYGRSVGYEFLKADGESVLVSKRAFFSSAMSDCKIGDVVRIKFNEEVPVLNKEGKQKGKQTMWVGTFQVKREGSGLPVSAILDKAEAKAATVKPDAPF